MDFKKRKVKLLVLGIFYLATGIVTYTWVVTNTNKTEALVQEAETAPLLRGNDDNDKQDFPLAAHEVDDVQYKTRFSFEHGKLVSSYGNQSLEDTTPNDCAIIVYFEKKYPLIYFDKYSEKSYTLAAAFEHSLSGLSLIVDSVFEIDADFQGLVLKTINPEADILQTAKELSRLDRVVLVQVKTPDPS